MPVFVEYIVSGHKWMILKVFFACLSFYIVHWFNFPSFIDFSFVLNDIRLRSTLNGNEWVCFTKNERRLNIVFFLYSLPRLIGTERVRLAEPDVTESSAPVSVRMHRRPAGTVGRVPQTIPQVRTRHPFSFHPILPKFSSRNGISLLSCILFKTWSICTRCIVWYSLLGFLLNFTIGFDLCPDSSKSSTDLATALREFARLYRWSSPSLFFASPPRNVLSVRVPVDLKTNERSDAHLAVPPPPPVRSFTALFGASFLRSWRFSFKKKRKSKRRLCVHASNSIDSEDKSESFMLCTSKRCQWNNTTLTIFVCLPFTGVVSRNQSNSDPLSVFGFTLIRS